MYNCNKSKFNSHGKEKIAERDTTIGPLTESETGDVQTQSQSQLDFGPRELKTPKILVSGLSHTQYVKQCGSNQQFLLSAKNLRIIKHAFI